MENKSKLIKKIAKLRIEFQNSKIKKTGLNKYSKFNYFELADIRPVLNKLNYEIGLLDEFEFNTEFATLKIYDVDTAEYIEFKMSIDIDGIEAKLNQDKQSLGMHPIQRLGGITTYLERYLLQKALGLTDGEIVDALDNRPKQNESNNTQKKQEINYRMKLLEYCKKNNIDVNTVANDNNLNKNSTNNDYKLVLEKLNNKNKVLELDI